MTETDVRITIAVLNCFHTHVRQGPMQRWMIEMLLRHGFRGYFLTMPNPEPPVLTDVRVKEYRSEIRGNIRYWKSHGLYYPEFEQISTIQITPKTTIQDLRRAYRAGVRHVKIYPKDVTTNSELGIVDYVAIYPILAEAEKLGIFVHFHGEHPSYDVEGKDKESFFLDQFLWPIVMKYPKLKIVLEHISTAKAVDFVTFWYNNGRCIAGSISPDYLVLTLDDVIGYSRASGCKGHLEHLRKPTLKWRLDRDALQDAAVSGLPYFFLGTDTAPHLTANKYCIGSNCGSFNTPVTGPLIIDLFERKKKLDPEKISYFCSHAGSEWFGLEKVTGTITYERKEWIVPPIYNVPGIDDGVVPMCTGWTMPWQIVN